MLLRIWLHISEAVGEERNGDGRDFSLLFCNRDLEISIGTAFIFSRKASEKMADDCRYGAVSNMVFFRHKERRRVSAKY